jgi:NADPH-dependent 2,4-dienoyl-CoA reductase/sulfur reductase-like enzyme
MGPGCNHRTPPGFRAAGTAPTFAMNRALKRGVTSRLTYDLAIIGGGINGTGIARDAALRGLSVALFERGDWGVPAPPARRRA